MILIAQHREPHGGRGAEAKGSELALDPLGIEEMPADIPLEDILASAPGPAPGGIPGLTDDEIEAFLEAIG